MPYRCSESEHRYGTICHKRVRQPKAPTALILRDLTAVAPEAEFSSSQFGRGLGLKSEQTMDTVTSREKRLLILVGGLSLVVVVLVIALFHSHSRNGRRSPEASGGGTSPIGVQDASGSPPVAATNSPDNAFSTQTKQERRPNFGCLLS
jgi:hypothetical protein